MHRHRHRIRHQRPHQHIRKIQSHSPPLSPAPRHREVFLTALQVRPPHPPAKHRPRAIANSPFRIRH
jgi:hypothetical protein